MKRFISTKFFRSLQKASQKGESVSANVLDSEFVKFASFVFLEGKTAADKEAYRSTLAYTRVELSGLTEVSEKNEATHLHKAIRLIDGQIEWTEKQILAEQEAAPIPPKLKWTGSPMELVELVYALHETGSFGKTPLKTVFAVIDKTFGCEITNAYRLFWDVRNRVAEDRAFFLNKLHKSLSGKLIRMDSGER